MVYATVTFIALGAISTLADATLSDSIPLGTGSATYALLFAALGWRWRHLDDPLSEGHWKMPATVVGLLMTALSLIALVLRDWLGPVLTSAVAGPFAIVLATGFLIAVLRVLTALLINSPLSAYWRRYLPGAVFVSGLSTGICLGLHVASGGNLAAVSLPWAMLARAPLMAFVTLLLAALFSLRREAWRCI